METNKSEDMRFKGGRNWPMGGVVLIIVGAILLLRGADIGLPGWLFSWPMILIAVATFIGARHSFQPGGWILVMLIGVAFLLQREILAWHIPLWPLILIAVGAWMIIRPGRKAWKGELFDSSSDNGDAINSSVLFGGIKKNVLSKNFKGGKVDTMFGGADINLTQADIQGSATLDLNVAFGGIKLIVPANWEVRNNLSAALGGVEDKRPMAQPDTSKVLILTGSVIFGGIDIKGY